MKKTILSLTILAMLTSCGNKEAKTLNNNNNESKSTMTLNIEDFQWTREPESCTNALGRLTMVSNPMRNNVTKNKIMTELEKLLAGELYDYLIHSSGEYGKILKIGYFSQISGMSKYK